MANIGRPLKQDAQARLRDRIERDGLERTSKALHVSTYLAAKAAAGANVAENSAFAIETRLERQPEERAA